MQKALSFFASFIAGALASIIMMHAVLVVLTMVGTTLPFATAVHLLPAVLVLVVGYAVYKATPFDANQFTIAFFGAIIPHLSYAQTLASHAAVV
jgi:hypothetical protein